LASVITADQLTDVQCFDEISIIVSFLFDFCHMFLLMLHANANSNAERRFDIIRCEYGVLHYKTEYVHCDKVVPSVKELTIFRYPPSRFVKLPIDLPMKILFLGII